MFTIIYSAIALAALAAQSAAAGQVNITGVVSGVQVSPAHDVSLLVRPSSGRTILVRLGPGWYLDYHGIRPRLRDQISVTGTSSVISGRVAIVAQSIVDHGIMLAFRDSDGRDLWTDLQQQLENGPVPGWDVAQVGPNGPIIAMPDNGWNSWPVFFNNGWGTTDWRFWRF